MTDLRKAAEMALNALEFNCPVIEDYGSKEQLKTYNESTMALYKALAQPEQEPFKPDWVSYRQGVVDGAAQPEQAPAAKHVCNLWINPETSFYEVDRCTHPINEVIPVYTAPPRKPWVGLTDDEIKGILDCGRGGLVDIKKAEQILKEKNT